MGSRVSAAISLFRRTGFGRSITSDGRSCRTVAKSLAGVGRGAQTGRAISVVTAGHSAARKTTPVLTTTRCATLLMASPTRSEGKPQKAITSQIFPNSRRAASSYVPEEFGVYGARSHSRPSSLDCATYLRERDERHVLEDVLEGLVRDTIGANI